ncbi:hypothetical protein ACFQ7M_41235 [Streptomyces massasporeus]
MRVQLTVAADDGGETITDLYCWLRQDRELRRHAEVRLQPPRQTGGHMGALEIIELVIAGTAAAAVRRQPQPRTPSCCTSRATVSCPSGAGRSCCLPCRKRTGCANTGPCPSISSGTRWSTGAPRPGAWSSWTAASAGVRCRAT